MTNQLYIVEETNASGKNNSISREVTGVTEDTFRSAFIVSMLISLYLS